MPQQSTNSFGIDNNKAIMFTWHTDHEHSDMDYEIAMLLGMHYDTFVNYNVWIFKTLYVKWSLCPEGSKSLIQSSNSLQPEVKLNIMSGCKSSISFPPCFLFYLENYYNVIQVKIKNKG